MRIKTYQTQANSFRLPSAMSLEYAALGLCGEAGEVAEKIKKSIRDGHFNEEDVAKEIGDVLWYVAALCQSLNICMEVAAMNNILKLESRKARNVLGGSGDDR